ncbi:copper homeostasis protein CutC [Acidicapsa dinghuensis]|uniref:PF03932 family protein CutC n=1 Tax=Acidicapsa dinghuensis TaxID=2218256 RepID=A0ABW1E937_9BACT|nr:copper homeostasis protein CutC [Acidicapsa dinghuensis]
MRKSFLFELCAESLDAAKAGQAGGADRIELCEELHVGGVSPRLRLLESVLQAVKIPVHVLVRPRAGDFVYSVAEFAQMREEILRVKAAGAGAIVVGVLLADGHVDVKRTCELVALARPMRVTFHRAFDEIGDQQRALEDVIATGADTLLTSGGAANVLEGSTALAKLHEQAAGRIEIMAGGGLRLGNLAQVVRRTGITCLHGSLSQHPKEDPSHRIVLTDDVREAVRLLQQESMAAVAAGR